MVLRISILANSATATARRRLQWARSLPPGFNNVREQKRMAHWFGIGCALLLGTAGAHADEFDAARQTIRDAMVAQNIPSVSVAVAQNGRILWEEGFGWADVDKRVPADAH